MRVLSGIWSIYGWGPWSSDGHWLTLALESDEELDEAGGMLQVSAAGVGGGGADVVLRQTT